MKPLRIAALTLFALSACVSSPRPTLESRELGQTPNVHALGQVWLAGQPSLGDLEQAKAAGIKTVINLRHEQEFDGFDEEQVVTGLGLQYVSLPWGGADELTDEVFGRTRKLLNEANEPVLLHCGSANRVGAVLLPWRVLDGGLSFEEALQEARTVGLRTEAYEEKAKDYVERFSK